MGMRPIPKTHFFIPTKPTKSGFHGYGWAWIWSPLNLSFGYGYWVCVWDPYPILDSVFFGCECINRPEECLSCKVVYWSYNKDLINQLKILLFWRLLIFRMMCKIIITKKFIFTFFWGGGGVFLTWNSFFGGGGTRISKKKVNPPSICNFFKC